MDECLWRPRPDLSGEALQLAGVAPVRHTLMPCEARASATGADPAGRAVMTATPVSGALTSAFSGTVVQVGVTRRLRAPAAARRTS